MEKRLRTRFIVDVCALITFTASVFSGVFLWQSIYLGLYRQYWIHLHTYSNLALSYFVIIHHTLNFKQLTVIAKKFLKGKRVYYLSFVVIFGLLVTIYLTTTFFIVKTNKFPVKTNDFNAYKGTSISDASIDGTIGSEWEDAGHYVNIPIDPKGNAEIWTKNDGLYLYIAIKINVDSSDPWIGLVFDLNDCHESTADIAVFGFNELHPYGYIDGYFISSTQITADDIQDGVGAMNIEPGNLVTIELKKQLKSGDVTGKDIAWTEGEVYSITILWDSDGDGSSGGSSSHHERTIPKIKTILINPKSLTQ